HRLRLPAHCVRRARHPAGRRDRWRTHPGRGGARAAVGSQGRPDQGLTKYVSMFSSGKVCSARLCRALHTCRDGALIKEAPVVEKIVLADKFSRFSEAYHPKIAAQLNDSYLKVVKLRGEFVWHQHANEDELFWVIQGRLQIKLRDGEVWLEPGELAV